MELGSEWNMESRRYPAHYAAGGSTLAIISETGVRALIADPSTLTSERRLARSSRSSQLGHLKIRSLDVTPEKRVLLRQIC